MKKVFESLKSEKFSMLDTMKMGKIRGGFAADTPAGPFHYNGSIINGAQDINRYDKNGNLVSQSFYVYASDNAAGVKEGWYTLYY